MSKGDPDPLAFWAHRLRGSLAVFGFTIAGGVARDIETLASEARLDGVGALVARLEEEIERVKVVLADGPSA
jgi:HPt (histidine-containing phosphotransfer) domain-containing protein